MLKIFFNNVKFDCYILQIYKLLLRIRIKNASFLSNKLLLFFPVSCKDFFGRIFCGLSRLFFRFGEKQRIVS